MNFSCTERNCQNYLKLRSIYIPDSLIPVNHGAQEFNFFENQVTVITIVGAGCTTCIQELKFWKEFIKKENLDHNINYYFIAEGKPNFYFNENVKNRDFLQNLPIFLDKDSLFIKNNNLSSIRQKHTIILNNENKIIHIGSPFFDSLNADKIKKLLRN